jgi:isoquinoline 1-oxidoreductase subunit beta
MPPRNASSRAASPAATPLARAAAVPVAAPASPITRRAFVRSAATAGGGLMLGIYLPTGKAVGQENASGSAAKEAPPRTPSAFLRIAPDDTITLVTPAVEMGQGGHTALPMILMEELGGDWRRLKVEDAPAAAMFNNPMFRMQITAGSFSVRGWYTELRRIGAAGREMLVAAAAQQWGVSAAQCAAANSVITHAASGRTCTYGSVASAAAAMPVPERPVLKGGKFDLIGTSPLRVDVADKVDGSARYGIDVKLPGMLYGAVKTCPTLGGKLKSFDDAKARAAPGFHATVALPDGVIVVARSYWQAAKALALVAVEYDLGALAGVDSAQVSQRLHDGFNEKGTVARDDGNVDAAFANVASSGPAPAAGGSGFLAAAHAAGTPTLEAVYEVPYLAHACMEPMNCTVRADESGAEVWCGTQSPQAAQHAAAEVLGIALDKIKIHTMYLGGGFGRRGEADYVAQAAAAAKATGKPVKLVWTREEDIQHDFYRPAAAIKFRAALDGDKQLKALECNIVTASKPSFSFPGPPFYTEGVYNLSYAIPNLRVTGVDKNIGVRFGFWRSVNESHNPFMLEGFIDEIAHQAGQDPYQFRRSMLQHPEAQRLLGVLDAVAEKGDWGRVKPGHALGIAAFEAFGSYIGSVVDVTVKDKAITLHKVVTAIDCGVAVHPDNIRAQLEGGMVYGLAAVLRGEITLENGAVKQSNFTDYPMLSMAEMPRTESYILPSTAPPGGIGEPGTGPIAPALANAIYAATGTRVRSLPLSKHGFTFSVARA